MSSIQSLPLEIIQRIASLSMAPVDLRTCAYELPNHMPYSDLRAGSLVCRSWRKVFQLEMCRIVYVNNVGRLNKLVASRLIQRYSVHGFVGRMYAARGSSFRSIHNMLSQAQRLDFLDLYMDSFWMDPKLSANLQSKLALTLSLALRTALLKIDHFFIRKGLQLLRLYLGSKFGFHPNNKSFGLLLPSLKSLTIDNGGQLWATDHSAFYSIDTPMLRELHFNDGGGAMITPWTHSLVYTNPSEDMRYWSKA
ncbi:BQ2448_6010 [Microbotryum intermedium]|uniref:BQ2448_6010 protein n=1 Tax=Microbotryum intermedium TaxID=269621 RepID=A0A238F677_9BASI|nr:BQ2448_6010 [Microbotryum intermedium]